MSRAVRFSEYGEVDVLEVVDVERPTPDTGEVLVEVRAAGINPGESAIRRGLLDDTWPATFPSGQGSDLAGVVAELGDDVSDFEVGDEVLGFTDGRASHAEHVTARTDHIVRRPPDVLWEQAGALKVVGTTAHAVIRAVGVERGDVVVVSGAAGGVGSATVQLAVGRGANVFGLASEANHGWLRDHGVTPVDYHGDGLAERIRDAAGGPIDAFIDTFGGGYVGLALDLGIGRERVNTIIDFDAAEKRGVQAVGGAEASNAEVLAELAQMITDGDLEIVIAETYPLEEVRAAFEALEQRHTRGKIVLIP